MWSETYSNFSKPFWVYSKGTGQYFIYFNVTNLSGWVYTFYSFFIHSDKEVVFMFIIRSGSLCLCARTQTRSNSCVWRLLYKSANLYKSSNLWDYSWVFVCLNTCSILLVCQVNSLTVNRQTWCTSSFLQSGDWGRNWFCLEFN